MPRILVAEPTAPIAASLRRFLEGVGEVQTAQFLDEAVQVVRARPPELVIASVSGAFDGEVLCAQVRHLKAPVAVLLVYPAEETRADERAQAARANGFLVGPLKRLTVLNAVKQVLQLRELKERLVLLEAELERLKAQAKAAPAVVAAPKGGLNQPDESFFKKYLLLEVKRSRRYQYPVAMFICEPDGFGARLEQSREPDRLRASVVAEGQAKLGELLRDIDVVLPFGEDRLLCFLPHTPHSGAVVVAQRALEKLAGLASAPGLKWSIGVASFDPKFTPKQGVSFGGLVRDANAAVKKAQEGGGNAVHGGMTPALPKKNRVSLA